MDLQTCVQVDFENKIWKIEKSMLDEIDYHIYNYVENSIMGVFYRLDHSLSSAYETKI